MSNLNTNKMESLNIDNCVKHAKEINEYFFINESREQYLYDHLLQILNNDQSYFKGLIFELSKTKIHYIFINTVLYKFEYEKKITKEFLRVLLELIYKNHDESKEYEDLKDELSKDIEDSVLKPRRMDLSEEHQKKLEMVVYEIIEKKIETKKDMDKYLIEIRKKYKFQPKGPEILYMMRHLDLTKKIEYNEKYEKLLRSRSYRSLSGVMVNAVFTSPYPISNGKVQEFSCEYDCYFCPKEPGQPRSYDPREPGNARARRNNYNPIKQFWDRCNTYFINGHPVDKIELLVLGGTWCSYPLDYRQNFIRDLYYAANTYYNKFKLRAKKSLEEERNINEFTKCRIIGLTLETRPDKINKRSLQEFRTYGVTRIQLGLQHTNDDILYRINRRHKLKHAIQAIKLLKDNCFKVDIHLMPDLPEPLKPRIKNSKKEFTRDDINRTDMYEEDLKMFETVLTNPDLQADQWKIYPCSTIPYTRIYDDYKNEVYKPYGNDSDKLTELLIYVLSKVHPWLRLNRVIRDIPTDIIVAGNQNSSLRQILDKKMATRNIYCKDIRNREVKNRIFTNNEIKPMIRKYKSSDQDEYFISFETKDECYLLGFIRLRLSSNAGKVNNEVIFDDLKDSALIRELHVYGQTTSVGSQGNYSQHMGLGKRLLNIAEKIAYYKNYKNIAVISGEGVRGYYRKNKYTNGDTFMVKNIENKLKYKLEYQDVIEHIEFLEYDKKNKPIKSKFKTSYNLKLFSLVFMILILIIIFVSSIYFIYF